MRKRDIRALREAHNKERWRDLWEPPEVSLSDEAWRDAIAENQSRQQYELPEVWDNEDYQRHERSTYLVALEEQRERTAKDQRK